MAFGLKVWDSSGTVRLDTSHRITRLRYSVIATAGNNGNVVLSDISGKLTAEWGECVEANKTPHNVSRSGTTISWTARGDSGRPSGNTLILVFVYT